MKVDTTRWLILILVLLFSSDVIAGKARAGSVRGDVYMAPDKSFQFKIPRLVPPDTFVQDVRESDDSFKIVMGDDLCRRLFVIRHELDRYADFDTYQQARIATMQIANPEFRELEQAQGRAVYVSGNIPNVPICVAMTFGGGGLMPADNGGSEVGVIFLETGNAWYEFGYVIGQESAFAEMYGLGDIEDELDHLIAGFKEAGHRQVKKLPATMPLIRFVETGVGARCKALGPIKGKSTSFAGTIDAHLSKAKAKLHGAAVRLGANAIVIRTSEMKSSALTGFPYMTLVGDALVCDEVTDYMAWEIQTS